MAEPFLERLFRGLGHALAGNALFGALAGAIVSGGFWIFGVPLGLMYALPTGLLIGIYAGIRAWPVRSIWAVCICEFVGAVFVAFGAYAIFNLDPPSYAFPGQVAGGLLGIMVGEALNYAPQPSFPACSNCGYNLTGKESGVCPECGKQTDTDLTMQRNKES